VKTKEDIGALSERFTEELEKLVGGENDEFVLAETLQKFLLHAAHREDPTLRTVRGLLKEYDVDEFDAKEIVEYLKADFLRRERFSDSMIEMLGENAVSDSNGDSHLLHLLYGRSCDLEYVFKKIVENRLQADLLTDVNYSGNPLIHRIVECGLLDETNVDRFAEVCHFYPELLRIQDANGRELQESIRISSNALRYAFEEAADKYNLKLPGPRASKPAETSRTFEKFLESWTAKLPAKSPDLPELNVSLRPLENRVVEAYADASASSTFFSMVSGIFVLLQDACDRLISPNEDRRFETMKEKYENRNVTAVTRREEESYDVPEPF